MRELPGTATRCLNAGLLTAGAAIWLAGCGDSSATLQPSRPDPDLPVPVGLEIEPLVGTPTQPQTLTIETAETSVDSFRIGFYPFVPLERSGRLLDRVYVFDDGTHGDRVAGDHVFTLDSLGVPTGEEGIGAVPVAYLDVVPEDPRDTPGGYYVKTAFRSLDPDRIPVPTIQILDEGVRATSHVVAYTHPRAGNITEEELAALSRSYYGWYPDDRDFLLVIHQGTFGNTSLGGAYHVRNDVGGLDLRGFHRPEYGSAGTLDMVVQIWSGVLNTPGPVDGKNCPLIHELTHRWAAFVDLIGSNDLHWRPTVTRTDSGFNVVGRCVLNDIELYLAGLLPADSVASPLSTDGVTLDQIVARHGWRSPPFETSQKDFTLGMIALHRRPLTDVEIAFFHRVSQMLEADNDVLGGGWFRATGGRSRMTTRLPVPAAGTAARD